MRVAKCISQGRNEKKKIKPTLKTRKEKRKEKRIQKKRNRHAFNENKSKKKQLHFLAMKKEKNLMEGITLEKMELDDLQKHTKIQCTKNNAQSKLEKEHELERCKQKQLEIDMAKHRKKFNLIAGTLEDDRTIKQVGKQLKINKRKSKNTTKLFAYDGLGYVLEMIDHEKRKMAAETEGQLLGVDSETAFEEDFAVATGQTLQKNEKEKKRKNEKPADSGSNVIFISNKRQQPAESDLNSVIQKKRKVIESQDWYEDDLESSNSNCAEKKNTKLWEDIYGRTRDKVGNILSNRYVPPAVRGKNLEEDSMYNEKLIQLKRQLKGLLNRLTQRNMHTISSQIEDLYQTNSRNDMNELTKLIIESLVVPIMTPDRLIMEHMMLIAVLHANVGSEVGSEFLLTLVKRIDESLVAPTKVENKELDNLILMLSHLYNFKVFGSKLIYDILEKLSEKFTEKEIDLILLILKSVGFALRKDNPLALKELILRLHQKAAVSIVAKCVNLRVKFMLDILLAIKNNNMNKIPQYDPSILDQMKKLLKTLIRKGNGISQLNITLEDILKVDERGKWWIVGAAWSGSTTTIKPEMSRKNKPDYSEKLLQLARKQRMNTDTRRNIFCILMSAEDVLDAFEKLHHLGLKDGQEKEIIYVLMNCCLQEKNFNPYYALLAQKLCDYNKKYKMTIERTLWDKLKILDTLNNRQVMHLAQFLTHLFLHRGLSISTMKVIQLEELDKPKMKLFRQIVLGILMHDNLETCLAVFERLTHSEQLKGFRVALRLFINQFVVRNVEEGLIQHDKASLIKERTVLLDRILTTRSSRFIF